jgi:hypothetical protein
MRTGFHKSKTRRKRAKQILTKDLSDKNVSINAEAQIRSIEIPKNFEDVKNLE